ncbi:MAG: hypothetical protein IJ272_04090 [Clostridia bacterium]|nr:hypothetical protein [Clostridia bacterium]
MKKGISLIVLVITIIVMIIIAGAIIISLNSSNVIDRSNEAVLKSNKAEATSLLSIRYAEILSAHYALNPTITYTPNVTDEADLDKYVKEHTANDWGVELKDGAYEVVNLHTTVTGSNG